MVAAGAGGGERKMGEEKLIIRSEKVRFIDILSLLLLRRPITSYRFVDAGDRTVADLAAGPGPAWVIALTEVIQKALAAAYYPAKFFGVALEFVLNFVALNGGFLGIVWNIFRCKLVIPLNREAPNFRSTIGFIDGRMELKPLPTTGVGMSGEAMDIDDLESGPLIQQHHLDGADLRLGSYSVLELTVMAAKVAYENGAYIENVVKNTWKYNFVGYYSCWNKFIKSDTTQAFMMTDLAKDAKVIVLSFRGTEPFNMQDWSTDVNLSWLGMGAMGHVHVGFLKALGLQEEDGKDASRAFPKDLPAGAAPAGKIVAYYKLREVLREQLKKHPKARVLVTGHSLGGALAAAFPALLALHGEKDVLARTYGVVTYGQPRVGDAAFAAFLRAALPAAGVALLRAVYRYDVVPRVPFDAPPVAEFKHAGRCAYYDGWYKGTVLADGVEVPNPNYLDPRYVLSMYGNAWGDLFKGMFLWVKEGRGYREGFVSIVFRSSGLILPGLASHSPRDYVNAVRLGHLTAKEV